jgi:hypothetical protein
MAKIEFKRGDGITHYFSMPTANWSAGGKLWFTAKPVIDDDSTDAAATITTSYTDSAVTDVTVSGVAYKKYTCYFPPSATNSIASGGAKKADYLGEFQWVSAAGVPSTFPGNDKFFDVVVYFDVKRAVA